MEDPGASTLLSEVLLIVALTLINAFLAGAELAFVSLNQEKMREKADEGDKKAKKVLKILDDSDAFLSTIQVGITLAGFLSSAAAASTFTAYLLPLMPDFAFREAVATTIVTIALSYISLVFGELFPKQVAIQFPEAYALRSAGVIDFLKRLFTPFVWLLTASTNLLKRLTPIEFTQQEQRFTRAEMQALIKNGRNDGAIDPDEFKMMQGVLSLDSKIAKEIMVARTDTFMIDIEDPIRDNVKAILSSPYTRVPIYQHDKDEVIGIVHSKDLLREANRVGFDNVSFLRIMNEPFFVPETVYIDDLLLSFKLDNQHLAVLKDEYGGVVGIVTLEDLIEEIVGEIEDEYDIQGTSYQKINENVSLIEGGMPIDDFNELYNQEIQTEESDTIAGYVIEILGHFPEDGQEEVVRIGDYLLTTIEVESGRIRKLRVQYSPLEEKDPDQEQEEKD